MTNNITTCSRILISLQNRVSGIVELLEFDVKSYNPVLINAIEQFKHKDISIHHAPSDFLSAKEKNAVFGENGNVFNVSLYKILLFLHIADGIKSGALNLKYSYRYLPVNNYLIDDKRWKKKEMNY